MVQRNSIIGSEKDLRKTSSVVLVTAMVLAGFFTLFAFAPANVVAAPELTAWGEDMAPPEGVFPGDNNISMMHLLLIAPQDAVGVYSLTFDLTASSTVAASGDIEKIFLFWDYDNNSKVDQFELNSLSNMGVLATVNNPTFPQTITLSSFTVAAADEEDIIVFIDTATGTSGKKVGLKLTAVSSDDPSPDIVNGASSDTSIKFIIWSDEMEGGVGGWTVTGTPKVLWHQTNYWYYVGESPSTSWWYADEAIRVYATGSQRNYGDLISESIDLSGYTDPAMSFWHDLVNENSAGYDEGALFIEDTAAPGVWNEIGRWYQSPTNWSKVVFNLSAYAGKTIRLKFNFDTVDGSNNWFRGWNIDRLYLFGGQEAHDIATMSFGTEPEKFALPGSTVYVNASIANLGQSDEDNGTAGIDVYLRIDGSFVDSAYIASIPQGGSVPVSFQWIPSAEGDYEVCIYAWPVSGETITGNNLACTTIQVRSVPAKKIVVVRSYGTKMGPAITTWVDLNANWESYGPTPIDIDWQSLNKTGITYADIVASGADTLVVSASAGLGAPQAWSELSDTEITAIRQYTLEGHGLVATYSTFYYLIPNNNKLTEMFGIQNQDYNRSISDANTNMHKLDAAHPLFNNVPTDPFTIGNPMSIWPKDDNAWNASDLRAGSLGGQYIAMSDNNETTLVVFKKLVFISWMPEWFGNTVDKQILYNAIVWSQYEVVPHDVAMSNIKGPSRVKPSPTVDITATLSNLASVVEDNGTAGIDVLLTQDGVIVDRTNIPSLGVGESQDVTLTWDPPDAPVPNTYNICMRAVQVVGETDTTNNEVCMSIGVISQDIIIVAILDSWGTDNPGLAPWDDINTNWASYGPYQILIDYTTLDKEDITIQDLNWSYADVLMISSSWSTGLTTSEFTATEITAIRTYIETMNHGIVATGLTFNSQNLPNNNLLSPLMGIDSATSFTNTTGVIEYQQLDPTHTVFYKIPDPFNPANDTSCTPGLFLPDPNGWGPNMLLPGAEYLGNSTPSPSAGAIVGNDTGTYRGIFLSSVHEMFSNKDDKQILYNAMIWASGRNLYPEVPPKAPVNLTISIQGSQLRLDWTPVDPAPDIWFNIFRATTVDGFNFGIPYDTVDADWYLDLPGTASDSSNYFYIVRAINVTSGLTENNTNKVGKFFNLLHKGTNDISIPFDLHDRSVAAVFGAIMANLTDIMIYDSALATWLSWQSGEFTEVDNTMGIRVISKKKNLAFITVGKVPTQTVIDLTIGLDNWFFVGYPNFKRYALPGILDDNGLSGLYRLVMYYDPTDRKSPWKWFDPNDPNSPLTDFETGKGYWIYMNADGTWTVPGE